MRFEFQMYSYNLEQAIDNNTQVYRKQGFS